LFNDFVCPFFRSSFFAAVGSYFFSFHLSWTGSSSFQDINNTISDIRRGDITCNGPDGKGCGEILQDHTINSGAEKRNFEGEDEKNHHGSAPNKLMPDVVNLETSVNILKNGKDVPEWKKMSYAQQRLEMDLR
jgi:transcription initiation factor TFIIIB Brf1 subunit/transcription initiation factor TFIIB